jgi:hypothetical protein
VLIAEGLEDAMTARMATDFKFVALAAGGVKNAKNIVLPDDVTEVILLADNDAAGAKGVAEAAARFKAAGKVVRVARPPEGAKDFNELVAGKEGEARAAGYTAVKAAIEAATEAATEALVAEVVAAGWPEIDKYGKPKHTYKNAIVALTRLGLKFSRDVFRHRWLVAGGPFENGIKLTDKTVRQLRNLIFDTFGFEPGKDPTFEAAFYLAEQNEFHPVLQY